VGSNPTGCTKIAREVNMKKDKLQTLISLELLEQDAQKQIYDALALPFLKKLAIMPDCHTGYTLPIGGVALLDGVVSPEYVGYDIGCGMICLITDINAKDVLKDKEKIFKAIYDSIPVGFNGRNIPLQYRSFTSASGDKNLTNKAEAKVYIQLGTLGSGNHFIELGENSQGKFAITIHSGSRNVGHSVADFYMKKSKTEDLQYPKGFLDINSNIGKAYLKDMNYCLNYALENRKVMLKEVLMILGISTKNLNFINENHNHLIITSDGVLHRKGATPADKDQYGVIPGNMRDGVYITVGLGNDVYLSSASHGAGRKMSRKKAKENIDIKKFKEVMKNVVAKVDESTLDEAPFAYKNLHDVIDMQKGIVIDVVDHIKPLINIKG
jgi:tRNA-splicing ligase RtcB (3'-phosphate/5'-hydroxy nucleic acid ligase)